ncbi:acetylornithine aminotransferase [Candidatus Symbiobacter mobilis CR]|uniref:Acetylornithine aminotransferase n=2 Tax=Candidatus Symbiobacter TaxID=1436289 RepID=U5NA37_9BURK|nr:aspartate aminotransferase family protein [Candidatus Symbiobacter mobilis]AGX87118.1 acetylornithine aminotransferase [Candidatus Symbiobacter mobilis CR]
MTAATHSHVMDTYTRLPIALSHGQGCRVWDTTGKSYLDAIGGIAVNTLGHNHPDFVAALREQLGRLVHCSNYYQVPLQEELAQRLATLSGMEQAFFCSTGLEANEAALKLARKYGHDRGIDRPEIVVYEKSFHGRSIATLSATGNPKIQAGFEPLVEGFVRVPPDDIDALRIATAKNPNIVAVLLEPIQGEGGVRPMDDAYLRAVRALCDDQGWLWMVDEIQCGMGRTGKWFAHQWAGVVPDVMTLAKGLGSGVPVGAMVVGKKACGILRPGNHGTTFGGNPLAMRAGVETLRILERDGLLDNVARVGDHLRGGLTAALAEELHSGAVRAIRGRGLLLGIELAYPCGVLWKQCAEQGLLLSVTAETVIRLAPPLVLTCAEADEIVRILVPQVRDFLRASATSAAA